MTSVFLVLCMHDSIMCRYGCSKCEMFAWDLPSAAEAVPGPQAHIMALEGADQESQQALLVGMEYLLSISFVDDDEVCPP